MLRDFFRDYRLLLRNVPSTNVTLFVLSVVLMNLLANKELVSLPYLALDCGITASILGASTKGIGEKAYGNMLLGIPGGDAELQRAMDYLRSIPDIFVEEVDGHV